MLYYFNIPMVSSTITSGQVNADGFACLHCGVFVPFIPTMGTAHRNHCRACLWSRHVDTAVSGDRKSQCGSGMAPVAITLKITGADKFTGETKYGDVMLVHQCVACGAIAINRIAADDAEPAILKVFENSLRLAPDVRNTLTAQKIKLLGEAQRSLLTERLFGKPLQ